MDFMYIWREWRASFLSGPCSECAVIQQQKNHQQMLCRPKNRKCLQLSTAETERLIKVRGGEGKGRILHLFVQFCGENKYLQLGIFWD